MILQHHGFWPQIHETAFIAPSADIIGEVEIGRDASVWFQCVIRGDVNQIRIGARTNIQDHSTLHVTRKQHSLTIGEEVTVGHRAMLHGCLIGDRVLVGMNATIMDGAVIGDDSVIGADALVTEGKKIPPRSLVIGAPGRVVRELTDEELKHLKASADHYVKDAQEYRRYVRGARKHDANDEDLVSPDFGDLGDEGEY